MMAHPQNSMPSMQDLGFGIVFNLFYDNAITLRVALRCATFARPTGVDVQPRPESGDIPEISWILYICTVC